MSINFIKKRRKEIDKVKRKDRKYLFFGMIIFIISAVISISLVSAKVFLALRNTQIKKKQENNKKEITQLEETEMKYLIYAYKMSLINSIFEQRRNKQEAMAYFSNLIAPDSSIKSMTYNNPQLSLNPLAPDVFKFENTYDALTAEEVFKKYPKVYKSNFSRSPDGTYQMSLRIDL